MWTGCSTDSENQSEGAQSVNEETHPIPDQIPHADTSPLQAKEADACDLADIPESLRALQQHIHEEQTDLKRIPIDVSEHQMARVVSIDADHILVMDTKPPTVQAFVYHRATDTASLIAKAGEGPGEINFPTDVAVDARRAYIAMGTQRIASFFCASGVCDHEEDIRVEFQPTALAMSDDHFVTTGILPLRDETEISSLSGAIHRVDMSGDHIDSFGEAYQTEAWLVNEFFTRNSSLVSFDDGSYAVHYDIIPRLYVYGADHTLRKVLEIDNFEQPTFEYEDGRRSILQEENYSRVTQLNALEGNLAFLTVTTRSNTSAELTEYVYDHYVMGVESGCVSHIGTEEEKAEGGARWVPTDHHLLRIEAGSVYMGETEG